jgi:hypothetical protein
MCKLQHLKVLLRGTTLTIVVVAGGFSGCTHRKPKPPTAHIPPKCIIGADVNTGKCDAVPNHPNVAICNGVYIHIACIEAGK